MPVATRMLISAAAVLSGACAVNATAAEVDLAKAFGAQERVIGPELSPDGKRVVYIGPGPGTANIVFIADVATGQSKPITWADGKPLRVTSCGWAAADRLICHQYGVAREQTGDVKLAPYSRLLALDADGKNVVSLGRQATGNALYTPPVRRRDHRLAEWRRWPRADDALLRSGDDHRDAHREQQGRLRSRPGGHTHVARDVRRGRPSRTSDIGRTGVARFA